MRDIFVSRPNKLESSFEEGFDRFSDLLESYDLKARTLGASDYATEPPLGEVISLMDKCVGAIILGYPQTAVEEDYQKGEATDRVSALPSATVWNHIEAAVAYTKRLPLLIMHHPSVAYGIFDRGALSKFLHEVDLSAADWSLSKPIIGALKAWREKLSEAPRGNGNLNDDLSFEPRSGTMVSKSSRVRYCHKCFHSSPSRRVELQEDEAGWRCSVCGKYYYNPNWTPPPQGDDWNPMRL